MFRAEQIHLDHTGAGNVSIAPTNSAMEWDIYQFTVRTKIFVTGCQGVMLHNGFQVTATPQASSDTATGPPDIIVKPGEQLQFQWVGGFPMDLAFIEYWYNENPVGCSFPGRVWHEQMIQRPIAKA